MVKVALSGLRRGSSAEPGCWRGGRGWPTEVGVEALWVGDHIALPVNGGDRRASRASRPWSRSPILPR